MERVIREITYGYGSNLDSVNQPQPPPATATDRHDSPATIAHRFVRYDKYFTYNPEFRPRLLDANRYID